MTTPTSPIRSIARHLLLLLLLTPLLLPLACTPAQQGTKPAVPADPYSLLDAVRNRKERQLADYLTAVDRTARSIGEDSEMLRLFAAKQQRYEALQRGGETPEMLREMAEIRDAIENRYIDRYLAFHDILMIGADGDIFSTIRRKGDYRSNIFDGELAGTALARSLRERPEGGFVDFENYRIIGEPSAFFVVPATLDGNRLGWFALSFSVTKINEMFSLEESLGRTGEVFLVNRERAMLTDSRFFAESSALQRHLSSANISAKFAEREGHKRVIDYRGFAALTSFKVISVLGSEWLLIAKIDEDEVISNRFATDPEATLLALEKLALSLPVEPTRETGLGSRDIEVDMDEFRRVATPGEELYTHGVRTCTAVLISYPGRFAYLAHLSANDLIYGGDKTDLIGQMQKRIDDFDLVRADKRHLQVLIVSPTPQYRKNLVDAFTRWGLLLSQIRLVFQPQARHANIAHDMERGKTLIEWSANDPVRIDPAAMPTLGELMTRLPAGG